MNEQELTERIKKIRSNMKWYDQLVKRTYDSTGRKFITAEQETAVQDVLDLLKALGWQLALNSYKTLTIEESDPVLYSGMYEAGKPVKVMPVAKIYGGKTYFGILIGEIPLTIGAAIDNDGSLTISRGMYNPAIYVPELKKVIFGAGSWWGEIKTEEDLNDLITDETIKSQWYVKALKEMAASSIKAEVED